MWYSLCCIVQTLYFSPSVSFSLSFETPHCCSVYGADGGLWFRENILRKPLVRFYHVKLGNYKHLIVEERSEAPGCIEILQIGVWGKGWEGWTWNIEHTIFGYKPYNQGRLGEEGGLKEKYVEHLAPSKGQHQYGRLKISCCTRNVCSVKIRIFAYLHFESLYQMLLIFSA